MFYSGFGIIIPTLYFITYVIFSEFIFDPKEDFTLLHSSLLSFNALLAWAVGSFLEKKRYEALNDPEKAEKHFFKWELPSTLFFIPVKWWGIVFIIMLAYFHYNGWIPVMTGKPPI